MARETVRIEVEGVTAMSRRLRALGELDAPEIAARLRRIADLADHEVSGQAPGSMAGAVSTRPARKLGGTIVYGQVKHPGARSMEFGRQYYYRGYKGRAQKSGSRFKAPGQRERPFVGIKRGDQAMGRLAEPVRRQLFEGIEAIWDRPERDE